MERSITFKIRQQAIIINNQGKILLLQYPETSKESNKWDLVGGHLEPQEHWERGLIREIKEETNLNVNIIAPVRVFSHKNTYIVFFAATTKENTVIISNEHKDYAWITLEELADLDLVRNNLMEDIIKAQQIVANNDK